MKNLDTLLEGSAAAHGHLCPGQVVVVRMAMEGCRLIGLDNPGELPQIKKLIVFVEMDRCAADAISYVTGAKLGRRSLKFVNYGIMAATRAIPLVITRADLDQAVALAKAHFSIFSVTMFLPLKIRLIITGDEVYKGLVQDRFRDIVREKTTRLGATLEESVILPDNREIISSQIREYLEKDTDLIITTGCMSVDPDDVTKAAIEDAGFDRIHYSAAVLPGAMFLLGYHRNTTIMGLPACGLYHRTTIFDLMLPRVMAGEQPGARDLARLGHGGLCLNCKNCRFPACSFGKPG